MSKLTLIKPEIGKPDSTEDVKIVNALSTLEAWANGNIDSTNLKGNAGITEGQLSEAVRSLINGKVAGLKFKQFTENITAGTGELLLTEKSGLTATLPASAANLTVGLFCGPAATSLKVSAPAGKKIYGDFTNGAGSITLKANQHVILQCTGENWLIMSGEPLNENKYTAMAALAEGAELTPSASRPSTVILNVRLGGEIQGAVIKVNGAAVTEVSTGVGGKPGIIPATLHLQPGDVVTWKREGFFAPSEGVKYSYRIL